MVEAKLRRESIQHPMDGAQHRHRMPLGLIMLAQGWITREQLQAALVAQRHAGIGRIGSWLIARCGSTEDHVTRALAMQWRCPVLTTEGFEPGRMALSAPRMLLEQTGLVPLRVAGKRTLYVGFDEKLDQAACLALERMSGLAVQSGLVEEDELREAHTRLCGSQFIESAVEHVSDAEAVSNGVAHLLSRVQPRASCLVRIHQYFWLRMWLESGAMTGRHGGLPTHRQDVLDRVYTVGTTQ